MDPATLVGMGMALVAILVSMIMEGGDIGSMFLIPPIILVFGGTIGAAVAGTLMREAKGIPKSLIKAMTATSLGRTLMLDRRSTVFRSRNWIDDWRRAALCPSHRHRA